MREHAPVRISSQNIVDTHVVTMKEFRTRIEEQTQKLLVLTSDLFGLNEQAHIKELESPQVDPIGSLFLLEDEFNKMRRAMSRLEDSVQVLVSSFREGGNL